MARSADYSKKVEALNEKIEKKTKELKNLKAERRKLQAEAAKQNMQEIADFIFKNNIDPSEVMQILKKHYNM